VYAPAERAEKPLLFQSTLISFVALPNPSLPSDRIEALVEVGMGGYMGHLPVQPLKNFHPQGFTGRTRVKEIYIYE
jgi:hypothetical protein